ncbi:MAG: L,D-transpeptidase [Bacteroidetes bacterium]|nr:L,D-transpeptidase [Bacteroidota bacterium]
MGYTIMKNNLFKISVLVVLAFTAVVCSKSIKLSVPNAEQEISPDLIVFDISFGKNSILGWIKIEEDIDIKHYFPFMDKLILKADTFKNWNINEYIIVHSNPWILDSLVASDYYSLQEKGIFNYDQTAIVILHKGDSIAIPDSAYAANINSKLASTIIDVNIPEFTLRLYQMDDTLLSCPVMVGRDAKKYIYVIDRTIDLKTPIGEGKIIRIDRMHKVINLDTGKEYTGTNRDDGKFTKMPIIPWIEPEINGIQYGAMIHPTTNQNTLGKAYSHGCVGTKEKDAWMIYYNAPIGTKVIFRYDLSIINEKGDSVELEDIYGLKKK